MLKNTRFEHSREAMELAHRLVKEYIDHEKEQDRLWKQQYPNKVRLARQRGQYSKPGGF